MTVRPGWIDLKLWMAVCWKVVWNVDPLAFTVPESLAAALLLPDEGLLLAPEPLLDPLELQAARDKAATVTPAAASP